MAAILSKCVCVGGGGKNVLISLLCLEWTAV